MFVENKGVVHITDPLFEVSLVSSELELLCTLSFWMEKMVLIYRLNWQAIYMAQLHTKRNKVLASMDPFSKISRFWLMKT